MLRQHWRTLLVLGTAVAAFVVLLVLQHRSRDSEMPAPVSDRQRLLRTAEAALREDPSVADFIYTAPRDRWDTTPAIVDSDPGSFARYVCFVLETHGVVQPHTSVRVIDGAALEATGFDYNAASRGTLTCNERTK